MSHTAYIGLGSNLDDPRRQVEQALDELTQLPATRLTGQSRLYQSHPQGPADQPDFINAAARLETTLAPLALLDALQAIEQAHHRVRERHWGPRTLDLDLLLYGQEVIDQPRLQVPHPEMTRRPFVLYPLADIDPALTLPKWGALASLLAGTAPQGLTPLAANQSTGEHFGRGI